MRKLLFIVCLTLNIWVPNVWGEGRFHLFSKHPRSIYVYLPAGYGQFPEVRYPVLYMHDGQNLFDPARAYMGQTWRAEETLNHLIKHKIIRPIIVVGIDNTPDRLAEYTPDRDPTREHSGGEGDAYLRFIVERLKPEIDRKLLTLSQRNHTGIMGSSLGGLISLYAGVRYHHTFGKIGALSPSVWWNNNSILRTLESAPAPLRVYVDSGTEGGERPHDARAVARIFEAAMGDRVMLNIQEGANHSERFWAMRFPVALKFLFNSNSF